MVNNNLSQWERNVINIPRLADDKQISEYTWRVAAKFYASELRCYLGSIVTGLLVMGIVVGANWPLAWGAPNADSEQSILWWTTTFILRWTEISLGLVALLILRQLMLRHQADH